MCRWQGANINNSSFSAKAKAIFTRSSLESLEVAAIRISIRNTLSTSPAWTATDIRQIKEEAQVGWRVKQNWSLGVIPISQGCQGCRPLLPRFGDSLLPLLIIIEHSFILTPQELNLCPRWCGKDRNAGLWEHVGGICGFLPTAKDAKGGQQQPTLSPKTQSTCYFIACNNKFKSGLAVQIIGFSKSRRTNVET